MVPPADSEGGPRLTAPWPGTAPGLAGQDALLDHLIRALEQRLRDR
jgi:hypothetical protein